MDTIYEVSHIEHRKVNTTSSKTEYCNEIVLKVKSQITLKTPRSAMEKVLAKALPLNLLPECDRIPVLRYRR